MGSLRRFEVVLGHPGRSNPSRPPPVQVQGEGVGGGVNLAPKGKKGVGRENALDHLPPEGCWDV